MHVNMDNKDKAPAKVKHPTGRVTLAHGKALGNAGRTSPSSNHSFKQEQKHAPRATSKRGVSDENVATAGLQHKRRGVLQDVSNFCGSNSMNAKVQTGKQARRSPATKGANVRYHISTGVPVVQEDAKTKLVEELPQISMEDSNNITSPEYLGGASKESMYDSRKECGKEEPMLAVQATIKSDGLQISQTQEQDIVDIDSIIEGLDGCCLYASEIYAKQRITELDWRPSATYMEKLQRDISPYMRRILIDWLVEVCEEYKLVADTLHLTVNLIDRFLSNNYIERERLQLLGVTSMLIASKYEDICSPHIEEFCSITDSTCTKEEVLEMERQIVYFLKFRLSVPTAKTFLRRFIPAAQASYEVPCIELEFLANYLAELTLMDYSFLNFLPSVIAASVVFLAKWTIDSEYPWNPTLEHYTNYKPLQLKAAVIALEDLQLNNNRFSHSAIGDKYNVEKFKYVASFVSSGPVRSLFKDQQ